MQIAVAGKGGSGKTTLSSTITRVLARRGKDVIAIDGDSNPNLGIALGLPADKVWELPGLPGGLLKRVTDEEGLIHTVLTKSPKQLLADHGVDGPDGIRMMVASRIDHAGAG